MSKFSLIYIRDWIDNSADGRVQRSEMEAQRRAIRNAGGYELDGIASAIRRMAGNRPRERSRGYLLDHRNVPTGAAEIAEILGLDVEKARWALRRLIRPEVAFLERVAWPLRSDDDRPAELPADGAGGQGADDPPDRQDAAETPPAVEPDAGGAPEPFSPPTVAPGGAADVGDGAGGCGQRAEKRGTISADGPDKDKEKAAVLPDSGKTESAAAQQRRKEKDPVEPTGKEQTPGVDDVRWEVGNGTGRGGAAGSGPPDQTEPGGSSDGDASTADPSRADEQGGEPAATGGDRHEEGNQQPPDQTEPGGSSDGDAEAPAPARPDEAKPAPAIWEAYKRGRHPLTWSMLTEGRKAAKLFGVLICVELGFPMDGPRRRLNEEVGTFRKQWALALKMRLPEAWLLELAEKGVGQARRIAEQVREFNDGRGNEVAKPGAVWVAWFKTALQAAVDELIRSRR